MQFNCSAIFHTQTGTKPVQLKLANSLWSRFRGLMLTRRLQTQPALQGLLITRCPSVHGFFMLYSLDIVYLAGNPQTNRFSITHIARLRPWLLSFGRNKSRHALELPSGSAHSLGLQIGDQLEIQV